MRLSDWQSYDGAKQLSHGMNAGSENADYVPSERPSITLKPVVRARISIVY